MSRRVPVITPRTVKTRRIRFEYPPERLPRHYVSGDLVMSHIISVLSALFPEGEDFFVRSVRNYSAQITDPELKAQVAGFIGQEVTHGREHRHFNERLREMGYPTRSIDRRVKRGLALFHRYGPKSTQLAVTAALEHYTATLAEVLLRSEEAQSLLDVDEVRAMLEWHALEENEHKSVAFDVYETVCGQYLRRIWVMRFVTVSFLFSSVANTVISLAMDRASYNPFRLFPSLWRLRANPWLTREVRRQIRDYNRPGFHPDDHDTTALVEEWKVRLFGDEGALAGR